MVFFLCHLWIVMLMTSLMFIHWTFWNIVAAIQVTGESAENIWFRILKPQNITKYHMPLLMETSIFLKIPSQKFYLWLWKAGDWRIIWKPLFLNWALLKGFHEIKCPSILACAVAIAHWFSTCGVKEALKEHGFKHK